MGLCLFAPPVVFSFFINICIYTNTPFVCICVYIYIKSVMFAVQSPKGKRRANYTLSWSGNVE